MSSPQSALSYLISFIFMLALPLAVVAGYYIKQQTRQALSIPAIIVAFVGIAGFIYGFGYGAVINGELWPIHVTETARVRPSLLMVSIALPISIVGTALTTKYSQEREAALARETLLMQNINHELRTPFALMYGNLELIIMGAFGEMPDEVTTVLKRIHKKMTYTRLLLERNLILLTMDETGVTYEPALVSVADIVEDAVADLNVLVMENGRQLTIKNGGSTKAAVLGDARLLWFIMNNLSANAMKFTPDGGEIEIGSWEHGNEVVIYVNDTGIGIAKEDQRKIFERFRQLDGSATRKHGGVGIGLHFVQSVAKLHGGRVTVQSSVGDGSTFFVYLPRVIDE